MFRIGLHSLNLALQVSLWPASGREATARQVADEDGQVTRVDDATVVDVAPFSLTASVGFLNVRDSVEFSIGSGTAGC